MSIHILYDLQLEVRRLFIAGSRMAEGDLRLTKILPQLQKLGETAAVFKRVAQALTEVVEPASKNDGGAVKLLDLSTLLNSILYTQGATEVQGESVEVEGTDIELSTKLAYRKLSPIIESLTTKGQGRMERLNQAYENQLLKDFRILTVAVNALDDGYAEVADFVSEKVIPDFGDAALPLLRKQFDLLGGRSHARRLNLMYPILKESGLELYLQAAREGSTEVRTAAIELLGNYPEQESFILEQADDKKKEIRKAAFAGLAKLGTEKAVDRLFKAITTVKDREIAVETASDCEVPELTLKIIANAEEALERIVSGTDMQEACLQLQADVVCLDGSKQQQEVLTFLKKLLLTEGFMIPETDAIQENAANILLWMGTPEAYEFLVSLQPVYKGRYMITSFNAAFRTLPADEVYERYAKELKTQKKKSWAHSFLISALHRLMPSWKRKLDLAGNGYSPYKDEKRLDPRWIHVLMDINEPELVAELAETPDKKVEAYLISNFQLKPKLNHQTASILLALFRIGCKEAPEMLMSVLEKEKKDLYYFSEVQYALFYMLPRSYADRLKQFAETLTYESVKRQVLDVAEQIAEKPEESAIDEKGAGIWGWIKSKMS
ncbi:HEAT repeat domain-containing protein [Paenibacillus agricola]|uniref:HEAT repeat domain-containing protein n=1 Tax=Paenibacillus agricola TaxID=2716264 RepID=A0ABX0JAD3_9BACL|nr:HEAT repeat domain-containing protein [Paenibacillus agricola]NHN33410.1 HEAT repeat domain-containing protein [Paenibacillus agricola]